MARKQRVEYEGALYHVMCRGDRQEPIFVDDEDRQIFLKTMGEACLKGGWRVHAYVLMGNHYHWLLTAIPQDAVELGGKFRIKKVAGAGFRPKNPKCEKHNADQALHQHTASGL